MTKPQNLEFKDCDLQQMRNIFASNAANVLPYKDRRVLPENTCIRYKYGKLVLALLEIQYYNANDERVAIIFRLTFDDGVTEDFPFLFRVNNTVYILSDW